MTSETSRALYKVQDLMKEARNVLDTRMYGSGEIPSEEMTYCRMVYDAVCKVCDLL